MSSLTLHRDDWLTVTNFSKDFSPSILRFKESKYLLEPPGIEDGRRNLPRNAGNYLRLDTTKRTSRLEIFMNSAVKTSHVAILSALWDTQKLMPLLQYDHLGHMNHVLFYCAQYKQ
jgi:hypothetical protein